jgi:hypothetical protein
VWVKLEQPLAKSKIEAANKTSRRNVMSGDIVFLTVSVDLAIPIRGSGMSSGENRHIDNPMRPPATKVYHAARQQWVRRPRILRIATIAGRAHHVGVRSTIRVMRFAQSMPDRCAVCRVHEVPVG